MSFANYTTLYDCVRPEFTDTLAISMGKVTPYVYLLHPILSRRTKSVVGNDTFASSSSRLQIITGPKWNENGINYFSASGKSIYLSQIGLFIVMAHIGSFIPCSYASIRITDKLLSRLVINFLQKGSDNGIEANASSFTLEMRETLFILEQVTDSSIVLIDELGRGIFIS